MEIGQIKPRKSFNTMISLISNSISVLMWICPQKLFFESSFNSPLKFDVHLFCFFQLLPCFVLLFYHSGLIIICNTVIFPVLEQGILSKKERQTNKTKSVFLLVMGFLLMNYVDTTKLNYWLNHIWYHYHFFIFPFLQLFNLCTI